MWLTCTFRIQKKMDTTFLRRLSETVFRDRETFGLLQNMDEFIDLLGEAHVFFALDANSACLEIETEKEDREKVPFSSRHGL